MSPTTVPNPANGSFPSRSSRLSTGWTSCACESLWSWGLGGGGVKFVGFGWGYTRVKEATSGVVLGPLTALVLISYLTLQPASSPMSHRTIHIACSKVLFNAITIRVPDLCHFSDYVSNRLNPFSLHTDYLIGKICHSFIYFQLCSNLVFQLNWVHTFLFACKSLHSCSGICYEQYIKV